MSLNTHCLVKPISRVRARIWAPIIMLLVGASSATAQDLPVTVLASPNVDLTQPGLVRSLLRQPDGNWLVAGDYQRLGVLRRPGLGRLAAGRVGNFINGELWGRLSSPDLPWGMVFRNSGTLAPRHPSQVYQFLLEGLLLFVLLWLYARKPRKTGQVSAAFLVGYGVFRFIAEFFREPDDYLGILALGMSMGQWLCLPMIAAGIWLWMWAEKRV